MPRPYEAAEPATFPENQTCITTGARAGLADSENSGSHSACLSRSLLVGNRRRRVARLNTMTLHTAHRRVFCLALASLALLVVVSGCAQPVPGGGGPGPSTGPGPRIYGPDDVVLRVDYVGGFVPVEDVVSRLPLVSVYGDGRVITLGPVIAIFLRRHYPTCWSRRSARRGLTRS